MPGKKTTERQHLLRAALIVVATAAVLLPGLTGSAQVTGPNHVVAIEAIPASAENGDYAALWSDGTLEVWSLGAAEPDRVFTVPLPNETFEASTAVVDPAGTRIAVGTSYPGNAGSILIVDLQSGQVLVNVESLLDVWTIDWSPDGTQLAVAALSGLGGGMISFFYIIDAATGNITTQVFYSGGTAASWSPLGDQIVITNGRQVTIWDVEQQQPEQDILLGTIVGLPTWSPDGTSVALLAIDIDYDAQEIRGYWIETLDVASGQITEAIAIDPGQDYRTIFSKLRWDRTGSTLILNAGLKLFLWNTLTGELTEYTYDLPITALAVTESNLLLYAYAAGHVDTFQLNTPPLASAAPDQIVTDTDSSGH